MKRELTKKIMNEFSIFNTGTKIERIEHLGIKLRPLQMFILFNLKEEGVLKVNQIRKIVGLAPSTITQTLDSLFNKELITRETSKTDRRVVEVMLTKKGNEVIETLQERGIDRYMMLIDKLGIEKSQELLSFFQELNDSLGYRKYIDEMKEKLND